MLMEMTPGVDFTKIVGEAFMLADSKSEKN